MLANIIDRRTNSLAATRMNVVMEPAWHSSCLDGADQYPRDDSISSARVRYGVSLSFAVAWAERQPAPMSLYLYDEAEDPLEEAVNTPLTLHGLNEVEHHLRKAHAAASHFEGWSVTPKLEPILKTLGYERKCLMDDRRN